MSAYCITNQTNTPKQLTIILTERRLYDPDSNQKEHRQGIHRRP